MVKGKCEALTNTLCIIRAIVPHTHTHTHTKEEEEEQNKQLLYCDVDRFYNNIYK